MRTIVVVCCLALAGCVEVTRFTGPGGDVYLAECDNPVRLQSCRAALESTCPNGYDFVQTLTRNQDGKQIPTNSGYFRCR
ncbi:MAG: hypothetical protein NVV74_21450 [Magnetospirillum sp.]|nr:hypothetical protein [Magnetospirillum sp.]